MTGQTLLPRPNGIYLGADPGADGAIAVVERSGDALTLLGVVLARQSASDDPSQRAAQTVGRLAVGQVEGVAVEGTFSAARIPGGQAGAFALAASGGAYAGALLSRYSPAQYERPLPAVWLADLACLADPGTEAGQRKALHVARLIDVCPGAEPHLRPPRSRVAHDGAADAALLALWAAGLRGPGPSSPLYRLADGGQEDGVRWVLRVQPDGAELLMPVGTHRQIEQIGAAGRRAAARGRQQVEPAAAEALRVAARVGTAAQQREASAALMAWGVFYGD